MYGASAPPSGDEKTGNGNVVHQIYHKHKCIYLPKACQDWFYKKKETPENPGLLFILSRFHHRHHQTHHHQNLHSDHNQCRVWRAYLR